MPKKPTKRTKRPVKAKLSTPETKFVMDMRDCFKGTTECLDLICRMIAEGNITMVDLLKRLEALVNVTNHNWKASDEFLLQRMVKSARNIKDIYE